MRFCARRALFSRPSSATGNPGGGLHRGLPGPVRGRAGLPGAVPGRRAHLAVGVLRGPGAAAAGQGGARRRAGETGPAGLEGQRGTLRRLEGVGPAQPRGHRGGPVHRGAADAPAGAARGAPRRVEEAADHGPRPVAGPAGGPGQPWLRAGRAGPAAGGGLHLRAHPGRHRLYRAGHRRVRPADHRVAHRREPQHGPGAGRAGDGGHLPGPPGRQGGRADPPQRRRQRVPVDPVRRRAGRSGHRAVGRVRRGLL